MLPVVMTNLQSHHTTKPEHTQHPNYWVNRAYQKVEAGEPRHDTIRWLAQQLRAVPGLSAESVAELTYEFAQQVSGRGRPIDEDEVTEILHWVFSQERMMPAAGHVSMVDEEFTDSGNAKRLAQRAPILRHVPEWGWLEYDFSQGRWCRDDEAPIRHATEYAQRMLFEAGTTSDRAESQRRAAFAMKSLSTQSLRATVTLGKAQKRLRASASDFDQQPMLLNVANGTVDLQTGTLREHRDEDMLTHQAPVEYDPEAACPRWEQFLCEVFNNDEELARYVQRALGYSITGSTREHAFFVAYGSGRNGKSTLLGVVAAILGDYAGPITAEALILRAYGNNASPELASMVGKRLVTAQEPPHGNLNTPRIKELTGGDSIMARGLYKEPFSFRPTLKLWLSTNERPRVEEVTPAIWQRIRLIPFTESFIGRENRSLVEELLEERAGILNWLIAGARAWQEEGLGTCAAVEAATRAYQEEQDPLYAFFHEVLVRASGDAKVLGTDAFAAYEAWDREARANTFHSQKAFYAQAELHGYPKKKLGKGIYLLGCQLNDVTGD